MTIAPTLRDFLVRNHVVYDVVTHAHSTSSMLTATACHIPSARLAKGVVLRLRDGYVLVVLPASHHIRTAALKAQLGEDFELATEHELDQLFLDCARGAVPPIGACYGLDVVMDDSIRELPEVYLEGGDHATLIHMSQEQFARLTREITHGRFAAPG